MKYTNLGTTDLRIPVLAQGVTGAGSRANATPQSIQTRMDTLRLAIDSGLTLLDMAGEYEDGYAERLVGKTIKGIRDTVILCTKCSAGQNDRVSVERALEASLKRLNVEYVDLYQLHWPNPNVPIDETMGALSRLKERGLTRHIGVSNFSREELAEAMDCLGGKGLVSTQCEYNLGYRSAEDVLFPFCRTNGITVLAYSLFNQGHLRLNGERLQLMRQLEERLQATTHQIILAWALTKERVVPIVRSNNPEHIHRNIQAVNLFISPEDVDRIDQIFIYEPVLVTPRSVRVLNQDVDDSHPIYTTMEQALENRLNLCPSPSDLARQLTEGGCLLKPVELRVSQGSGNARYELLHGRIRFWGWVIAYGWDTPIPAIII